MDPVQPRPPADELPPVRHVHHVHRSPDGSVHAVCGGVDAGSWSPRTVTAVAADVQTGTVRYAVPWLGGERPLLVLHGERGRSLHSPAPGGPGNGLDDLPACPVHPPWWRTSGSAADLQACRDRHPSSWRSDDP